MNTTNQKHSKQERAVQLFEKTPIKKAIFIVAIPGLLTMIMMGLYAFFNQVFILNFVPRTIGILDGDITNNAGKLYEYLSYDLPHLNRYEFNQLYTYYFSQLPKGEHISNITSDVMASISINATIPFALFANAAIILIPMGTSVYYTKCITKKVEKTGKDLWATTFWATVVVSVFTTLLIFICIWTDLTGHVASHSKFNSLALASLDSKFASDFQLKHAGLLPSTVFQGYYQASHEMSTDWANTYLYIYAAGSILQGLYLLLSYLIRAEGKNANVMIWAIISNVVGLAFDALFIIVLRMGILGGALATMIGWIINLAAYVVYIVINIRRDQTWLSLIHLLHFNLQLKFLGPVALLGLSAFIRTLGVAILNLIITLLLNDLPFSDGFTNIYNWAKAAPSIVLFFLALFGISDGTASLLSYNYTQKNVSRVRQIYWWALLISVVYAIVVYIIVAVLAKYFAMILYVPNNRIADVTTYLRLNMARMVFYSLAIGGILLFRGTNDIKMSILVTAMETFITFWFVMGACVGIGFALQNAGYPNSISSLVVSIGFSANALVTGLIIFGISIHWLYKTLPNIDNTNKKESWSSKVEKNFFYTAMQLENQHNKQQNDGKWF